MNVRIKFLFVFKIIIIIGCDFTWRSEPISESEVVGVYVANFDAGILEKITINQDSSYIHYFVSKDSTIYVDTNKWELYCELGDSGRPSIIFYDFINRYPIDAHCYSAGKWAKLDLSPRDWNPYIFKRGKIIRIERCNALNQNYYKQNK